MSQGKHFRHNRRSGRRMVAACLIALTATTGIGAWAISEATPSGAAAMACVAPRHWTYVATGYSRQTGTAFGYLTCR